MKKIVIVMIILMGCNLSIDMHYIPEADEIYDTFKTFILDEEFVKGIEANMDVDSLIFEYHIKKNSKLSNEEFLKIIMGNAEKRNWNIIDKKNNFLRFSRYGKLGEHFSCENVLLKIKTTNNNRKVTIAYAQADSDTEVKNIEETYEFNFIENIIWKRFTRIKFQLEYLIEKQNYNHTVLRILLSTCILRE